jgi:asparagine synthase (glutamine-hydrolysing)
MCGIAASTFPNAIHNEAAIRALLRTMRHRGLLLDEMFFDSRAGIGANRLPIIDRLGGCQPTFNEARTVCAVLNGEIYNHENLRAELQCLGHRFSTKCDTEVLVHLYEECEEGLIQKLEGMFSFVLYDRSSGRLLAGRDRFGIKPLYIASTGLNQVLFASELKAFSALDCDEITALPPGSYWDGCVRQYYTPTLETCELDYEAATRGLRSLLEDAVRSLTNTDLPIAVFVSGGIDSAAVLQLAVKYHPCVTAITVGAPGSPDVQAARELCKELGVPHVVKDINYDGLRAAYSSLIFWAESFEPNVIRTAFATDAACRMASDLGFRIALAGEGSDELFAGYADFVSFSDPVDVAKHCKNLFMDLHRTQLQRWDRCAMRHTVEVRFPFLERPVVEFALQLPSRYKLQTFRGSLRSKAVLRDAVGDLVPARTRVRAKIPMDEGTFGDGRAGLDKAFSSAADFLGDVWKKPLYRTNLQLGSKEDEVNWALYAQLYGKGTAPSSRVFVRRK